MPSFKKYLILLTVLIGSILFIFNSNSLAQTTDEAISQTSSEASLGVAHMYDVTDEMIKIGNSKKMTDAKIELVWFGI